MRILFWSFSMRIFLLREYQKLNVLLVCDLPSSLALLFVNIFFLFFTPCKCSMKPLIFSLYRFGAKIRRIFLFEHTIILFLSSYSFGVKRRFSFFVLFVHALIIFLSACTVEFFANSSKLYIENLQCEPKMKLWNEKI